MKNAIMILLLSGFCLGAKASLTACEQAGLDTARDAMIDEMVRLKIAMNNESVTERVRVKNENDYFELVSNYGLLSTCENTAVLLYKDGENFQQGVDALYKCRSSIPRRFIPSTTCDQ